MEPFYMRTTYRGVELGVAATLVALGIVILLEGIRLGPGWGWAGPQPGFFPTALTVMMAIGIVGVVVYALRKPDLRPFFEAHQEVVDMVKVGVPIFFAVLAIRWLGLYVTSGLYMAFFMAWYGRFRLHWALLGGILFPLCLWLMLRQGFNIPMPMSVFYRQGILPF